MRAPTGWRAPYWSLGPQTLELVEAAGFAYDCSLMADDYRLYRVRHGDRHSIAEGTQLGRAGALVEVPVYWALDDWPHFEPGPGPRRPVGAVDGPRDLDRGAALRPRARPGRPADDHDAPRVHRARPPDGDAGARSSTRPSRSTASSSSASTRRQSLGGGVTPDDRLGARRRTASNIGCGQPAGERVLLARVVRAESDVAARRAPPRRGRTAAAAATSCAAAPRAPGAPPPSRTRRARRGPGPRSAARARGPGTARRCRAPRGVGLLAGGAQRTAAAM